MVITFIIFTFAVESLAESAEALDNFTPPIQFVVSNSLCPGYARNCGNSCQVVAVVGAACTAKCANWNGAMWCPTGNDQSGDCYTEWGWCAGSIVRRPPRQQYSDAYIASTLTLRSPCSANMQCGQGNWCSLVQDNVGPPAPPGEPKARCREGPCKEDEAVEHTCPSANTTVTWQKQKKVGYGCNLFRYGYNREYRFRSLEKAKIMCDEFGPECSGIFDSSCSSTGAPAAQKTAPDYYGLCDSELYRELSGACVITKDEPPVHWWHERLQTSCFRNFVKKPSGKEYRFQHLKQAKEQCDKLPQCSGIYDHRCQDPNEPEEDPAYYALCDMTPVFRAADSASCVIPKSPYIVQREVEDLLAVRDVYPELEHEQQKEYEAEVIKFEAELMGYESKIEQEETAVEEQGWVIALLAVMLMLVVGYGVFRFYKFSKNKTDNYTELTRLDTMSAYAPPSEPY